MMPNNEDEWIDEIIESSSVPDLRDGESSTMDLEILRAAIQAKLLEARLETAEHIKNICPVTDEAAAERLHNRIGTYVRQLQASAPTKRGRI